MNNNNNNNNKNYNNKSNNIAITKTKKKAKRDRRELCRLIQEWLNLDLSYFSRRSLASSISKKFPPGIISLLFPEFPSKPPSSIPISPDTNHFLSTINYSFPINTSNLQNLPFIDIKSTPALSYLSKHPNSAQFIIQLPQEQQTQFLSSAIKLWLLPIPTPKLSHNLVQPNYQFNTQSSINYFKQFFSPYELSQIFYPQNKLNNSQLIVYNKQNLSKEKIIRYHFIHNNETIEFNEENLMNMYHISVLKSQEFLSLYIQEDTLSNIFHKPPFPKRHHFSNPNKQLYNRHPNFNKHLNYDFHNLLPYEYNQQGLEYLLSIKFFSSIIYQQYEREINKMFKPDRANINSNTIIDGETKNTQIKTWKTNKVPPVEAPPKNTPRGLAKRYLLPQELLDPELRARLNAQYPNTEIILHPMNEALKNKDPETYAKLLELTHTPRLSHITPQITPRGPPITKPLTPRLETQRLETQRLETPRLETPRLGTPRLENSGKQYTATNRVWFNIEYPELASLKHSHPNKYEEAILRYK